MRYTTDTVPKLIRELSELGGMEARLEVYDTSGNRYEIVEIYTSEIDDDENTICFDIEKVDE